MNVKIYKQLDNERITEESLFNVIKIEETDDFGYIFTMLEPYTNETIIREIPKEDVMLIPFHIILKFKIDPITNKIMNDITELKKEETKCQSKN